MKLHLPIALLAAIVSSQFAVAASTTQASANASGVTFDNSNPGHANVTISANAGDLTGYYMYGTYGSNPVGAGIIGAAASGQDTKDDAPYEKFESATITMNGGKLGTLSGHGVQGNAVTGDTTVIMNGGSTGLIVGGTAYTNKANRDVTVLGTSPEGWDVTDFAYKANYLNETDESIQKQNINIEVNGGTVGQIRGTHSGHSQVHLYTDDGYLTQLHKSGDADAIAKYMQSNPLALSGNVNIDVNGGSIIAKNAGDSETAAIYGGGGTGFSVDGSVNIAVGGDANLVGDIIAGSSNNYTFVGSTNTVISGGSIKGNVYGGGDGSDPKSNVAGGQAPLVKNGTTVVLSGGTIDGDVYAAGLKDQVNGGTNVVIKNGGTKVTGTISGMGVDSEVNGERLLSIENSAGINVSWNQFQDFNAVEFTNSEIEFGTLSEAFEKVSAEGSWLEGKFEDGEVQLNANNSWLEIGGSLTTTEGSSITNTKKPMTVDGTATFNGTTIGNSTIKATENVIVGDGSSVTGSTLNAANGSLAVSNATVTDSTLTGATYGAIVGSTVSGSSVAAQELVVNTSATITDSTLTADNNLIIERSTVSGSSATSTYLFVQNGAEITDSTLTADKNVFIANGSTVSGSSVTSTTAGISVTGSTLTNADLYAREGKVTITDSSYTNSSGANYIVGGSVSIEDTTITSTKDTLFIKGDTTIANGDFSLSGGSVYFYDDVKADKDSSFVVNKGVLTFGDNADDVVTLNGSAVENNGGTIHAYGKIDANNAGISATAGATHFHNVVEATGTAITAQGGAAMHFDEKVVLDGSKVTTLIGNDSGKSARTIAAEEIAAQLVPDDAKDSLDTLAEIAAWIQSHPDDAAAMNVAIENLKKITKHFYNNGSVTENSIKTYIDDAIDALKIGDYAKAADLTALAARVTTAEGNITTLQGRKVSAGDGLNGGGTLGADRTISHKPATGTNGLGLGTIGTGDFISAVERDTYGHLKSATGAKFSDRIKAKSSLGTNEYAVSVASNTTNKGVDLSVVIDVIDGGTF